MGNMERDWAYFAGIIDGEGSFSIVKYVENGRLRYRLRLYVTNANKPLMDWATERFGGRVYARTKPTGTVVYQWHCRDSLAREVIAGVRSHLIVKAEQAEIADEFISGDWTTRPVPKEAIAARESLWHRMGVLNFAGGKSRKGPPGNRHGTISPA